MIYAQARMNPMPTISQPQNRAIRTQLYSYIWTLESIKSHHLMMIQFTDYFFVYMCMISTLCNLRKHGFFLLSRMLYNLPELSVYSAFILLFS